MAIPILQIKQIVDFIFSKNGYDIKNLNISFPQPLDIKVIKDTSENIILSFTESLPKVTWQKYIKLSAYVQGLTLGKDGGTLKLRYLPDIKFSYDENSETLFGSSFDTSDIEAQIDAEYADEERNFLAKKCLQYGNEWATIASQGGMNFAECDKYSKRQLKRDCKDFVMSNIKQDPEVMHGSVVLTFLLIYVVLPVILKFILERLFRKLFNEY
jgi:hypothetical protein